MKQKKLLIYEIKNDEFNMNNSLITSHNRNRQIYYRHI